MKCRIRKRHNFYYHPDYWQLEIVGYNRDLRFLTFEKAIVAFDDVRQAYLRGVL